MLAVLRETSSLSQHCHFIQRVEFRSHGLVLTFLSSFYDVPHRENLIGWGRAGMKRFYLRHSPGTDRCCPIEPDIEIIHLRDQFRGKISSTT
jgi:hypothetical protein